MILPASDAPNTTSIYRERRDSNVTVVKPALHTSRFDDVLSFASYFDALVLSAGGVSRGSCVRITAIEGVMNFSARCGAGHCHFHLLSERAATRRDGWGENFRTYGSGSWR